MPACAECYSEQNRKTPLLGQRECLENHEQYICGTCGQCICIARDKKRGVQRWNFPFKSLEVAILYLRTADVTEQKCCGIYEIVAQNGRKSYKIFPSGSELAQYLKKNKDKTCVTMQPQFRQKEYYTFPNSQIRVLTPPEVEKYLLEQQ